MAQQFSAASIYGIGVQQQPTATAAPAHAATASPEPFARTVARPSSTLLQNPTLLLVALLGVTIWLIHFSVSGSVSVKK